MLKKLKKFICLAIALVLSFGVTACGGGGIGDTQTDLLIKYWDSGYGDEWIEQAVTNFKALHPEYVVELDSSPESVYFSEIGLSGDYNKTDLYITSILEDEYPETSEPLDDVLTTTIDGESKTIAEKFDATSLSYLQAKDGHYYGLPMGTSITTLVYNADVIDGTTYNVPLTTDELYLLVLDLMNNYSEEAFIHYYQSGYWDYLLKLWQVQYDGKADYYETFLPLKDAQGNSPSKDILKRQDGRYKAIEVINNIISQDTVDSKSTGSNFTDAQTYFMNGEAVMMATGTWLVNEMKTNTEATTTNLLPMRLPVISAVIEKCTTLDDDSQLSALISAIDTVLDNGGVVTDVALTGEGYSVNETDRARIWEARALNFSANDSILYVIPNYATAKDAAKDFIRYCYSDEGLKVFTAKTHTIQSISLDQGNYDTNGWLPFELRSKNIIENSIHMGSRNIAYKSKVFTSGGGRYFGADNYVIPKFNVATASRATAASAWADILNIFENDWNKYVSFM